jgi:hypothetical protein
VLPCEPTLDCQLDLARNPRVRRGRGVFSSSAGGPLEKSFNCQKVFLRDRTVFIVGVSKHHSLMQTVEKA